MRFRNCFLALLGLSALFLASGCGTRPLGSGGGASSGTNVAFTLAVTDQPPSGVTLLSFTITITGAVLQPNNVSVLNAPVTLEVTQLQTDTDLLSKLDIPTGNYTDLVLTFSNPSVTILNQSVALGTCAVGTICQITEALSPSTVDFNTGAFPLSVPATAPVALLLDFSLNNLLQPDMTLNLAAPGGFALTQFQNVTAGAILGQSGDVAGVVTSVGSNQFTFTTLNGISVTAATTSSTQFFFPTLTCEANDFTCITTGELISTDLSLLGNGTFQAATVGFEDVTGKTGISGTVVSVNTVANPPTFNMVIHGSAPTADGIDIGDQATVTIEPAATLLIDNDVLALASGFTFATSADLVVGQEVLVRADTIATAPNTITTTQIVLRQSEWTANVGTINVGNSSFALGSLPSLFTTALPVNITSLNVNTFSVTQFLNLTPAGIGGLAAQNPVSVKGLIFNTITAIGQPSVVATVVVGRNPTALP
jgi:Domain of unknown function (DUF4382)